MFTGEKLVELQLQYSRVKKLWHNVPDVVNLKVLILTLSTHLMELPDLSKATNLAVIDLRLCLRLTSVHPSVFSLNKLSKLDLGGCISLTSLRSKTHLNSLRYLSLAGCISLKKFSVISKNMIKLNLALTGIKKLPPSIGLQSKLEKLLLAYTYIQHLPESIKHLSKLRHLDLRHCRELRSLPELPSSLETLDASGCVSLETITFPSTFTEQLKENKKRVAFWNCLKLDQHSVKAIGLNAQTNMMKFAYHHISTFGPNYGTYVYPGSSVPDWLMYRTTENYITVDRSFVTHSSEQLGFIFCFIVPEVPSQGFFLKFNISVGEDEGVQVYLDRPTRGITSDHVYIMFDQGCSRYLNARAKDQPKLEIKVTAVSGTLTSQYVPFLLKGFGDNSDYSLIHVAFYPSHSMLGLIVFTQIVWSVPARIAITCSVARILQ
ncbi:Leucine-rich repeat [Sesbania bispinosa]|nr:Leucine-rich repeat [Sesbania bispinosa]